MGEGKSILMAGRAGTRVTDGVERWEGEFGATGYRTEGALPIPACGRGFLCGARGECGEARRMSRNLKRWDSWDHWDEWDGGEGRGQKRRPASARECQES